MENADDDPFDSLMIPYCKPTSSQEEKLQVCPFACESEVFPGYTQSSSATDEASKQATEIIIVSLTDSSEDYQTPPEQQSHSQNSSNDGQVPSTKIGAVDWIVKEGSGGDGEAMSVDNCCERERQRTIDLSKDPDNLGFSGKSHTDPVEDNDTVMIDDNDTEHIDAANGVNETEAKTKNGIAGAVAELTGLPTENTQEVFVEMPLREQDESTSARKFTKKNIDDVSAFKFVGTRGKRELPFSLRDQKKSGKVEDDYARHKALKFALDHALKLVGKGKDGDDEDDRPPDFLKTAKRRGLTFPRPRWWPPEGFEG